MSIGEVTADSQAKQRGAEQIDPKKRQEGKGTHAVVTQDEIGSGSSFEYCEWSRSGKFCCNVFSVVVCVTKWLRSVDRKVVVVDVRSSDH
jgi:hypothetical protein